MHGGGLPAPPSSANAVLCTQVAFMACAYGDAFLSGDLDAGKAHISAVLDHSRRSLVSVVIGLLAWVSLVKLELHRPASGAAYRLALASLSGLGIVTTAAVRESGNFPVHAVAACTAFGAAILLTWFLVADETSLRRAQLLTVVCVITGGLQFAYLGGLVDKAQFPSWMLGLGEFVMVVLFGYTISVAPSKL